MKGVQYRARKVRSQSRGADCDAKLFEVRDCRAENRCPVNCEIGEWNAWGRCDAVQCLSIRTRFVRVESKNGGRACPSKFQSRACTSQCHRFLTLFGEQGDMGW